MKNIRAIKTYVFAPYSRSKGETATVPDAIGEHLVRIGFAEYVKGAAQEPTEAPEASGDKIPAEPEKKAHKSARKSSAAKK